MSIITLKFLIFLALSVLFYYLTPKHMRWIELLLTNIVFFVFATEWYLFLILLGSVAITYIGTNLIHKFREKTIVKRVILILLFIFLIGSLFIFKYFNIIPMITNGIGKILGLNYHMNKISLLAPIGISYYTLSIIGYVLDVYWGTYEPEKNPFKLLVFTSLYPMMISGPIIRYGELKKELFPGNKLDYNNIYRGFARIIYGFAKKIIVADQLAILVATIFGEYQVYSGYYIIIGVILYAIQIYADFSGCMDIILGAGEMYGIHLPENFNSPFFSKNLSEFWRRWHISLGTWAKDYIMYPILKSKPFQNIGIKCKKRFGKKTGKKIPTIIAIFILWMLIGLWHGASFKYIFAAGLMPWIYLTLSQVLEEPLEKIKNKLNIDENNFSYHLFQSIKTVGLMCIIWLIVCSPSLRESITVFKYTTIFPTKSLYDKLLTIPDMAILVVLILMTIVDYLKYKDYDVNAIFQKQNILFKWLVLFFLIGLIVVYGAYGPGYNPAAFIYGGF